MATSVFNSGSGNWAAVSTWTAAKVPTVDDDVLLDYFNPARPQEVYQVGLSGAVTVRNLTIMDGNALSLLPNDALLSLKVLVIGRDGRLTGTGTVQFADAMHNHGTIDTTLSIGIKFAGAGKELVNTGTVLVSQAGSMQVDINTGLHNSGLVHAKDDGRLFFYNTTNSGVILSEDAASITLNGAIHNTGKIEASRGRLLLAGETVNSHGGQLLASDEGTLAVAGLVSGGLGIISGKATLLFLGPAFEDITTSIAFHGPGTFILRNSSNYAGTVDGFGAGDRISVGDIAYSPGANSYDPQSGILTIGTTKLQLTGTLAADDFTFRADDTNGGTLVTYNLLGSSAALTVEASDLQLGSLYLGYFGRAADPEGLSYWQDQLDGGSDALSSIAESFSKEAEATSIHRLLADPQSATQGDVEAFVARFMKTYSVARLM